MADDHTHMHNTEIGGIGLATVLIGLIFLFVWPGPLRYEYSYRDIGVTRIDRLNGKVSLLKGGNYVRLSEIAGKDFTIDQTK